MFCALVSWLASTQLIGAQPLSDNATNTWQFPLFTPASRAKGSASARQVLRAAARPCLSNRTAIAMVFKLAQAARLHGLPLNRKPMGGNTTPTQDGMIAECQRANAEPQRQRDTALNTARQRLR
jgi:hypothetical protein